MNAVIKKEINAKTNKLNSDLRGILASVGFGLGLTLFITGVCLTIYAHFEKNNFDYSEISLILTSFVLFGFGAHSVDLLEKDKQAKRRNL